MLDELVLNATAGTTEFDLAMVEEESHFLGSSGVWAKSGCPTTFTSCNFCLR